MILLTQGWLEAFARAAAMHLAVMSPAPRSSGTALSGAVRLGQRIGFSYNSIRLRTSFECSTAAPGECGAPGGESGTANQLSPASLHGLSSSCKPRCPLYAQKDIAKDGANVHF